MQPKFTGQADPDRARATANFIALPATNSASTSTRAHLPQPAAGQALVACGIDAAVLRDWHGSPAPDAVAPTDSGMTIATALDVTWLAGGGAHRWPARFPTCSEHVYGWSAAEHCTASPTRIRLREGGDVAGAAACAGRRCSLIGEIERTRPVQPAVQAAVAPRPRRRRTRPPIPGCAWSVGAGGAARIGCTTFACSL